MDERYTRRHAEQRRCKNADQAELDAILLGSVIVDQGVYDDRVAGALDDFEPEETAARADWHRQDLSVETAVGEVHEEVERRASLLGEAYPFVLNGGLLTYKRSHSGFYEFCLAISLADQITRGNHVHLPRTFERLSALLMQGFLGGSASSLHLGTPRDEHVGARFVDAMRYAHEQTREWLWAPEAGLPLEPSDTGDHGVDFVAWLSPPDGRNGSLFILGQCACGDDWTTKFEDVNLRRYRKWFNPLTYVDPMRAFTTPHHVPDAWLDEALRLAGLVFDRARLTRLAEAMCEGEAYQKWSGKIEALTRLVVPLPKAA
jgi:hypothetical protein